MVRGHGPSPGHDTWCGPGATPMIAQSPADSPGMPGQMGRAPPLPSSRAPRSRRSPASFEAHPGPDPPRPRRSPRGTLPSGLRPCRRPQIRFTPSVRVISSRAPTTTSTRPISRTTSSPGTTSSAPRRSRRWPWAGPARDTASHSSVGPTIFSRPAWPGGPEGASIPASPASEGSTLLTIASRVSSGSSRRRSRSRCAGTTPLPDWSQRMRADGLANGTVNSRLAMARAHLCHAADADPSLTSAWLASRKVPTPPAPKGRRPVTVAGDLPAFLDAPERTRLGNRDRPIPIPPLTRHGDEGGRARWRHPGRPGGAERGAGTRAGSRQGAQGAAHRPVRQGGRAPACLSGRLPWGRARPVDVAVLHRGPRRDARDVRTQRRAHRGEVRRRRPGGAFGHPAHLSPHGPQNPCDNALP